MLDLQTPVQFVKGIGPRRAQELALKNILTVEDLLYHLPYRYEDRTHFRNVKDLQPGEKTSILVEVMTAGLNITARNRLRIFELAGRDETAMVRCKWFHSEYLEHRNIFRKGQIVIFHGKFEVDPYGTGNLQVINPEFEILGQKINPRDSIEMGRIVPVYEAIKSCSSRIIRRAIHRCLLELQQLPEILPTEVLIHHNLIDRKSALNESHFPSKTTCLEDLAKKETPPLQRLIFEELFLLEVGVRWKRQQHRTVPGIPFAIGLSFLQGVGLYLGWNSTREFSFLNRLAIECFSLFLLVCLFIFFVFGTFSWGSVLAILMFCWIASGNFIELIYGSSNLRDLKAVFLKRLGLISAHLGMAFLVLGVGIVTTSSLEREVVLSEGEAYQLGDVAFTFKGIEKYKHLNYLVDSAKIEIEANGNFHELNAEKRNYLSSNQIMTEAAIKPSILQDYYVTLGDQLGDKTWSFKIQIKPFIRWIWFGAMLIALGIFVSSYKNFKRDYE